VHKLIELRNGLGIERRPGRTAALDIGGLFGRSRDGASGDAEHTDSHETSDSLHRMP